MYVKKVVLVIFGFLLMISLVAGAPSITGVVGSMNQGSTVTITANSIGENATIYSWDTFESGGNGDPLAGNDPIIGFPWSLLHPSSNTPVAAYSTERAQSGSVSAKIAWKEPGWSGYSINAFGWAGKGPLQQLYISFWEYHDILRSDGQVAPPDNLNQKLMFTYGDHTPQEVQQWLPVVTNKGGSTFFLLSITQNNPPLTEYWDVGLGYMAKVKNWQRWETFVKFDNPSSHSTGEAKVWRNGVLHFSRENYHNNNVPGTAGFIDDLRIGHMFQGFASMTYARSYFDNVYVASSKARVELGDNQNYLSCSERIVQIADSWSGNTIVIDSLRTDGFGQGQTAWLFVIDENGAVSAGEEITIGAASSCDDGSCSGGETCESCPADCGSCPDCVIGEMITSWCDCAGDNYHSGYCCENGFQTFSCSPITGTCGANGCEPDETCESCPQDCGVCCGNGEINTGEDCDGSNLNGQDCTDFGFSNPVGLVCSGSCTYDDALCSDTPFVEVIVDDGDVGTSDDGHWIVGSLGGGYNDDYLFSSPEEDPGYWYEWSADLAAGSYEVFATWEPYYSRPTDVSYRISHSGGTASVGDVDQTQSVEWYSLGTYDFDGVATVRVISGTSTFDDGGTCADAIRFVQVSGSDLPGTIQELDEGYGLLYTLWHLVRFGAAFTV